METRRRISDSKDKQEEGTNRSSTTPGGMSDNVDTSGKGRSSRAHSDHERSAKVCASVLCVGQQCTVHEIESLGGWFRDQSINQSNQPRQTKPNQSASPANHGINQPIKRYNG